MGFDFTIFWAAARAFMAGQSPYTVGGFISPLPFLLPISPLALLPYSTAFVVWTIINLIAVVVLAHRRAFLAVLFLPVVFALWYGQVDLMIIALAFTGTWWGLALAALKPQLAIWLIPFFVARSWKANNRNLVFKMLLAIAILYVPVTLIQPAWWTAWFDATPSILSYTEHASSLFGISALLNPSIPTGVSFAAVAAVTLVVFLTLKPYSNSQFWNWAAIFNPLANIYSLCLLVSQVDWIAVVLSWLLLPVSLFFHTGLPWACVPLYLLWRTHQLPNSSQEPTIEAAPF